MVVDAADYREGIEVHREPVGVEHLRYEADVGECRPVAVAEFSGGRSGDVIQLHAQGLCKRPQDINAALARAGFDL